jgi:hypothetical protein
MPCREAASTMLAAQTPEMIFMTLSGVGSVIDVSNLKFQVGKYI